MTTETFYTYNCLECSVTFTGDFFVGKILGIDSRTVHQAATKDLLHEMLDRAIDDYIDACYIKSTHKINALATAALVPSLKDGVDSNALASELTKTNNLTIPQVIDLLSQRSP